MSAHEFVKILKQGALNLGFAKVGITTCKPFEGESAHLKAWVEAGGNALFPYRNVPGILDPGSLMEGAQSALVVFLPYHRKEAVPGQSSGSLKLSRYLWGPDYHPLIKRKLHQLLALGQEHWQGLEGRACVDTAPLMERAMAVRAGLGWQGRNTMLIAEKTGSFGFLGVLLMNAALPPDPPFVGHRCGTCRACLDACPAQALAPFTLNPRRCLSTYTLEHEGEAPLDVLTALQNSRWAAGCDRCQEVCPWNRNPAQGDPSLWGGDSPLHTLSADSLTLGTAQYSKCVRSTAMRRIRHRHWLLTLKRIKQGCISS